MNTLRHALALLAPLALVAGCDSADGPSVPASPPSATEAAAAGIVETLGSAAAGRPIPREGLPDYVETREGGRYMTGMNFSNELRQGGMVMYSAPGPLAEVMAFHRASLERHGMTPGEAAVRPVRDHMETTFEGRTADGKSHLTVTIIDKSEPDMIVQLNYADEKN